jgi:hypothetical protein
MYYRNNIILLTLEDRQSISKEYTLLLSSDFFLLSPFTQMYVFNLDICDFFNNSVISVTSRV